jgi:hypothetical protein
VRRPIQGGDFTPAPTKDVADVGGLLRGPPARGGIIRGVDEELVRWYAERDQELDRDESYWAGYADGLARLHEPEPRDPDDIYFGPDGRVIESQAAESH